ncbi:hypothetical protein AB205_0020480, partial [Aquarana catesbeiana]
MCETPPAPDLFSSIFPAPSLSAQWGEHMAEKEQVHADSNSNDESPEPQTSRSWRRFKASNMSFVEMVEMVDILKRADYDGKHGPYPNPNVRKAKIMAKVVKSLHRNFGVQRSKDQLRKCWSDLKLSEHDQYGRIKRVLQKREKRLGTCEDTMDPPPLKEKKIPTPQPDDVEEGEVYEVGKIVTTTVMWMLWKKIRISQVLIGEIMVCNREEGINDIEKRLKNIVDVLGRI